jgi:hypothetical protein
MDVEKVLQDYVATKAINELRALYGWYAARGDYRGIAGLFTPDGVFEVSGQVCNSQTEIIAFLAKTMKPGMVAPMIHNEIVVVDSATIAHGTCAMESRPANGVLICGYYHDKARVHDGKWRFTSRRFFFYQPELQDSGMGPMEA